MTGPNNLNERIMRQKRLKKHEVWVTCEQWAAEDKVLADPSGGDFEVYPSLDEALQAWTDLSNVRHCRKGCKVTPSDIQDYISDNVIIQWYNYTNAEGYKFLIRTIIVRKYYYK